MIFCSTYYIKFYVNIFSTIKSTTKVSNAFSVACVVGTVLTVLCVLIGKKPWGLLLDVFGEQSLADSAIQVEAMSLVNRVSIIWDEDHVSCVMSCVDIS